jgi:hypothetical protein
MKDGVENNPDYMAVVEGGYNQQGQYIGSLGKYNSSKELVSLENNDDLNIEELTPQEKRILESMAPAQSAVLGLPSKENLLTVSGAISGEIVSLPSNKFGYDDKGKYVGEEGIRDQEGNLEELD